ncbi:MAG: coenzyme F420-0:L-glutamate ligase [bacterium]|nr:coenzyme F420-0:L-glutamate ligase [bacterium]
MEELKPNQGKNIEIEVEGKRYARFPVRTHVITKDDNILAVVEKYAQPYLQKGDQLFISERVVAISQGRAYPIKDIHPSKLAKFLVKFVKKSPYGIGLGSPWTMELAIREAGKMRIIFAAAISAITKPFGWRGVFYKVVGKNINAIDGPCDYTLPPYNEYAKLGPRDPHKVAREIKNKFGSETVIIDANDLGVEVLGQSDRKTDKEIYKKIFKDNPLGQATEQTPLCIVRLVESS